MAVNSERSMSQSLMDGSTDGMLKKPRPDTVVDAFDTTADLRMPLYQPRAGYGFAGGDIYDDDMRRGTVSGVYDKDTDGD